MTINSRNKGSTFEREVAKELEILTGISFCRNLEQVRTVDHSDLTPGDPAFPFALECKRVASGNGCKPAWRDQSRRAAAKIGKIPCVIYKFDRRDIRVSVPVSAIGRALGADWADREWADITLPALAYLAREIMAETNSSKGRGESPRDRSSRRALAAPIPRQIGEVASQGAKL